MAGTYRQNYTRHILRFAAGVCVAFLLGLLYAASASAGAWTVVVRPQVCVDGPQVYLGDIADAVGDVDEVRWDQLSRTALWKASTRRGRPATVLRAKLKAVLRQYVGASVDKFVLPERMVIQTGGRVYNRQQLHRMAVAFLTPRIAKLKGEAELKDLRLPDHVFLKNNSDKIRFEISGDLKPGRVGMRIVTVTPEGRITRRLSAGVFLNLWRAVPVAARPLNRGEMLDAKKISFVKKNLAYNKNLWNGKGGPWRVTRAVGRGTPITLDSIDGLPMVAKGERVKLLWQGKTIQLTITVLALKDGKLGQKVPVRNMQSKRTILATVVGRDMVQVK